MILLSHCFSIVTGGAAVLIVYLISVMMELSDNLIFTVVWLAAWGANISSSQSLIALKEERLGVLFFYSLTAMTSSVVAIGSILAGEQSISIIIQRTSLAFCVLASISSFVLYLKLRNFQLFGTVSKADLLRLINIGIPFSFGRMIQAVILWVPVWLSGILHSQDAAGIAAALIRFGVAFGAVMAAIRLVFRRWFVQELNSHRLKLLSIILSTLGSFSSSLALLAAGIVLLLGKPLLTIFFGYEVGEFNWLMAIMLLGIAVEAQFGVAEDLLRNSKLIYNTLMLQVAALGLQIMFSFALFTVFGWSATISGYLIQLSFYQLVLAIWTRRYLYIHLRPIFSLRTFKFVMKVRH